MKIIIWVVGNTLHFGAKTEHLLTIGKMVLLLHWIIISMQKDHWIIISMQKIITSQVKMILLVNMIKNWNDRWVGALFCCWIVLIFCIVIVIYNFYIMKLLVQGF